MKANHKFYRLNYQIASPQLRLLDEKGKQIGIVSKIEALQKAKELEIDVVEIAPNAKPPVAKLIDFKKFKYQEAKKERESKKLQKNVTIKEIRLGPFIGQHDLEVRVAQAKEFLADGNQLKVKIWFRGRQITRKEFGFEVMNKFIGLLENIKVVREPRLQGRTLEAFIVGDKKKV
ncbi:translation initiation factor IF-3 [Patescibacteria group bacterium]|nr:translation initiation factor IF-3 [Patescibacteria group bacterium]MBU2460224.1 translation initiation factor IF-3 [Patescibacteria group bacterium]MBU2543975.1 translation initiation factor IF-3 [Patescibacteria group bacterium]